ncbi:histone-lysine N-methyltransferase SETDB2 [Sphaeramia orbicularis]|uniref:histone-lysine N-methyltransferase SETDB2 n=1 Tax=Sphaeramia orbicularis TaxID=375764 RepID=UPI00117D871B|nr:histone-lysine N-methyltransferase SETDB2-like [Sphaeramia orbicularis]
MEMDAPENQEEVERAKAFWGSEDVDQVFNGVFSYLDYLKHVLKKNMASDKEYVQGLKLLEALDWSVVSPPISSSVVQVVIGSDSLSPVHLSPCSPSPSLSSPSLHPSNGSVASPAGLVPVPVLDEPHVCCPTCLPSLPSMPQCTPLFWGQNPLRIPLLCGFRRLPEGAEPVKKEGCNVTYRAPCGWSLRNHNDVMKFLLATDSYDVLQVDFFTFNPSVRLDTPPGPAGPRHPELDLSRGAEPTPVELVGGEGGTRPADFRYRKERWPHGCFLSRGAALFNVCCDCTDGCSDAQSCACVNMTTGGRHYQHHRLSQPVPSGLYECGPWCSCDRARCQNRLVQRGIRLRLQVFHTDGRGWGVRCRDDVDCGTFVCIYAGVILQRIQSPLEAPPPKLTRADLPSDDEVEVVTEWLAPPVLEGWSNPPPPASAGTPTSEATPPLHVPVIQRPPDANATTANTSEQDKIQTVLVGRPEPSLPSVSSTHTPADVPSRSGHLAVTPPLRRGANTGKAVAVTTNGTESDRSLKRPMKAEDVYFIDATKEGNVSRFINHSCEPNLFIQNVFTDSHDPAFPVIAFFTRRALKAGSELFWDYSADTLSFASSLQKQEVPCLCRSDGCRGTFTVEDNLCEVCEFKGQGSMEAE